MESAGAEAGPARLPPGPGVPSRDPSTVEVGYGLPSNLGQPSQPSGVHAYPPPGLDMQPRSTSVHPVVYWDQSIGQWVRAPSVASGLSSFPSTPEASLEGFIAQARGTCQNTKAADVSQCVAGASGLPSTQPSQASSVSGGAKSKYLLINLQRYDGSISLETFLLQFKHLILFPIVIRVCFIIHRFSGLHNKRVTPFQVTFHATLHP